MDGVRANKEAAPLQDKGRLKDFVFYIPEEPGRGHSKRSQLSWPQMDLGRVLACRWGGLNPQGTLDEYHELFNTGSQIHHFLQEWMDTPTLFLCPSFEPLDLADFCRFGHLPVYPLGLMTGAALNADGIMHTPLAFLEHDLGHVSTLRGWLCLDTDLLLESPQGRDRLRCHVLDHLPAVLKDSERAVASDCFSSVS